ncbi:hypothetical protein [Actinomadura miaoliensis]|uniref:Uncharacterized protein n=1 Tax=Actinomadura miaoliensis TaxID=430685 RepID=A0ABP7VDB7_9ACTN
MVRRLGLAAAVLAACVTLPSSAVLDERPFVDADITHQLTVAARAVLQYRSEALVQRARPEEVPTEVLGVRISPRLARQQHRAARELQNRSRAPVEGGPPYTGARTRLEPERAIRTGDRITLDATEHTEVRYETGKVTQSVRRRFDFTVDGPQVTLVDEHVRDPEARPVNDPRPER